MITTFNNLITVAIGGKYEIKYAIRLIKSTNSTINVLYKLVIVREVGYYKFILASIIVSIQKVEKLQ